MDACDRLAELRVVQRTEPSGTRGRIGLDPRTQRLDHDDVAEPAHDRGVAGTRVSNLVGEEVEHRPGPATASQTASPDHDPEGTRRSTYEVPPGLSTIRPVLRAAGAPQTIAACGRCWLCSLRKARSKVTRTWPLVWRQVRTSRSGCVLAPRQGAHARPIGSGSGPFTGSSAAAASRRADLRR